MPVKYHLETKPVPPRRPRIGKYGIIDWREDCARCHNCVKKACVYDRHRDEMKYIQNLDDVDALFFDCMGCFSCVQECTKNLLRLSINPVWESLGNWYWKPEIIQTTWLQAETAKIPVSGAGYGGKFSGFGFDSMWTDMSEIVRPTRDGIHGREYISTAVDVGKKPSYISLHDGVPVSDLPSLISTPMPLIIDMIPAQFEKPKLEAILAATAVRTDLIAIIDSRSWPIRGIDADECMPHLAFYFASGEPLLPREVLSGTRLVEFEDSASVRDRIAECKAMHPGIVASVRVTLDAAGMDRAVALAASGVEVVHVVADMNGNQVDAERPLFLKEMIRTIHTALIREGLRDEVTIIAGGGIALPEHMAKAVICGSDLVSIELPLLIGLECQLCGTCDENRLCPAKVPDITMEYGVGRMTNLISAWHNQLIELMGAMGMRDARRLRGDVGRAMFFEQLEEETFGRLFGTRLQS
jgi:ferredoxin